MPKTRQSIKAIESELITALEFIRLARAAFPITTDKILGIMDLSDEGFAEELTALANTVGFDFNDPDNTGAEDND